MLSKSGCSWTFQAPCYECCHSVHGDTEDACYGEHKAVVECGKEQYQRTMSTTGCSFTFQKPCLECCDLEAHMVPPPPQLAATAETSPNPAPPPSDPPGWAEARCFFKGECGPPPQDTTQRIGSGPQCLSGGPGPGFWGHPTVNYCGAGWCAAKSIAEWDCVNTPPQIWGPDAGNPPAFCSQPLPAPICDEACADNCCMAHDHCCATNVCVTKPALCHTELLECLTGCAYYSNPDSCSGYIFLGIFAAASCDVPGIACNCGGDEPFVHCSPPLPPPPPPPDPPPPPPPPPPDPPPPPPLPPSCDLCYDCTQSKNPANPDPNGNIADPDATCDSRIDFEFERLSPQEARKMVAGQYPDACGNCVYP